MNSAIRCFSVIPSLAQAAGGPSFGTCSLCEAQARAGIQTTLFSARLPGEGPAQVPDERWVEHVQIPAFGSKRLRLAIAPGIKNKLRDACRRTGGKVLHSHGLWTHLNWAAGVVARELRLPLMVSVHGMLEPWAWRHRAWKKRPVWWLWQRAQLQTAAVLRSTSPQETLALRAMGLRSPVALLPNGVELPAKTALHTPAPVRTALFLSRLHPKKGLLNLVRAWSHLRPRNWRIVICGPDEGEHRIELLKAIHEAGLDTEVVVAPPAYGLLKDTLFQQAHLFVLPTMSENFGIVIAEALAAGLPVITTKGAPWECLQQKHCGWWIDVGVEPLCEALSQALALGDDERQAMGRRGRELVASRFSWQGIAEDTKRVYQWMLGTGPKPSCVIES